MAASTLGANCLPGGNASISTHKNAVAIEVGQDVYIDETDGSRLKLADNTDTSKAAVHGIAVSKANAANQRVSVVWSGDVEGCTGGVQFEARYASDTPGSMCPVEDLASGDIGSLVGIFKTATVFTVRPILTGVAHA